MCPSDVLTKPGAAQRSVHLDKTFGLVAFIAVPIFAVFFMYHEVATKNATICGCVVNVRLSVSKKWKVLLDKHKSVHQSKVCM